MRRDIIALQAALLPDVLENTVELVEAVIGNHELARTLSGVLDPHSGTDLFRHLNLQTTDIRVGRRKALAPVVGLYDFILIDCPPSINMLTINALTAADGVLIPMQCEYYALEGLSSLLNTIEKVRNSVNPDLEIFGILRTMFDPRINLSNEVSMQLIEHFDKTVFRTVIPRNIRLAEAPSFGRPVLLHDRSSRGAICYLALAGEILRREDARMAEAV